MKLRFISIAIALSAVLACNKEEPSDPASEDPLPNRPTFDGPWPESSGTVDVEWDAATTVIDEAEVEHLSSYDLESGIFEFSSEATDVATLQPGDIAVFPGVALRRIDAVVVEGDVVRLETSFVTLPEAIESGTIEWDRAIDWGEGATTNVQGLSVAGDAGALRVQRSALLEEGIKWEGELATYKVELGLTPSEDWSRLDLDLKINKAKSENKKLAFHAQGWISRFRATGDIDIADNTLEGFKYEQKGLKGEMHATFVGLEFGQEAPFFEIPATIEIPWRLGPIPVKTKISVKMRFVIELQVLQASSQVEVLFSYDGDFGVELAGAAPAALGSLQSHDLTIDKSVSAANGPAAGVGVGLEAPRVAVELFNENLVPYITLDQWFHSTYTFDPACQDAYSEIKSVIGVDFKLLGFTLAEPNLTIWKESHNEHHGAGCAE